MLHIYLLQSVPLIKRNEEVVSPNSQKAEALLFYVLLAGEEVYRREYLASLFWGEDDIASPQDNFRQALQRIKNQCGDLSPAIVVDRKHIKVDRSAVRIDTDLFLHKIKRAPEDLDEADLKCDIQDLLGGFQGIGESFTSWTRVYQSEFERRALAALSEVFADTTLASETRGKTASLILKIDPTDEKAVRFRMRDFAEKGQKSAALKTYNTLYWLLDEHYDTWPEEKTVELNKAIELGEIGPHTATQSPQLLEGPKPIQAPPQVFVADFDIETGNPVTERMGSFFRAEVLGNLSKFREWNVVFNEPVQRDFYQLDCQIEGYDKDIAVIVTLHKRPEQRVVWTKHYVTGFDNWLETQWHIAQQLALGVNQSLTVDRIRTYSGAKPDQRSVFDKWAMCHSLNLDWSPAASNKVIELLHEIIDDDPSFSLAHSYLAETHNKMHLVYPGTFRSKNSVQTAVTHAETAMRLDPLDCHAHRVLAWAKTLNGEFEVGEFHFNQAYELNPSNLYVSTSCALGFAYLDNLEKACQIADQIRAASVPLSGFQWGYMQNIYYLAGRLQDAKSAGDHAGWAISNLPAWQAIIHADLGEPEMARRCMARFFRATRATWSGAQPATREAIVKWLLHLFPMKNARKRAAIFERMLGV